MHLEAANYLVELAHQRLLGVQTPFCGDRIRAYLRPVLVDLRPGAQNLIDDWLAQADFEASSGRAAMPAVEEIAQRLDPQIRRDNGIYLTPRPLADAMAGLIEGTPGEAVLDLSAGAGTLLSAAMRRAPHLCAVGVEKNPVMAIAAAINLAATRKELVGAESQNSELFEPGAGDSGDRIYVGDGLSADQPWCAWEGRAAAMLGNPPYLREKGNRELFQSLRSRHAHLAEHFCARMDLQYLFFHRSASFLRPGARLVFVTSAYWLSATHARKLRRDMAERLRPELLLRVEKGGIFPDAPGQHTLVSVFCRPMIYAQDEREKTLKIRAVSLGQAPANWTAAMAPAGCQAPREGDIFEHDAATLGGDNWSVFVAPETMRWGRALEEKGTMLDFFLQDRQGFVSGADRFTRRHRNLYDGLGAERRSDSLPEKDTPIFLFERPGDIPESLSKLGPSVLRPVLRASEVVANEIYFTPPGTARALYLDGPVSAENEAVLATHLGQFRPILERRREVGSGIMPWYRLHWPRSRAEQTGPKLVAPRRSRRPCFALDLSGSAISSDCTYLVSRNEGSIDDLIRLMVVLNSPLTERYLRHFGKSKGQQLEFYSEPLRTLPLPLCRDESGALAWVEALLDDAMLAVRDACEEKISKVSEVLAPERVWSS